MHARGSITRCIRPHSLTHRVGIVPSIRELPFAAGILWLDSSAAASTPSDQEQQTLAALHYDGEFILHLMQRRCGLESLGYCSILLGNMLMLETQTGFKVLR